MKEHTKKGEASPSSKPNILIVDDTVANLKLLASMLKEQGYIVRPVNCGKLALQAVEIMPPDLILLDIKMPQMNGYEICQRLKAQETTRNIPVIFISALSEVIDKVKAFSVGGVDYITKPFQFEEVQARVEAHTNLRRLRLDVEKKNRQLAESLACQQEVEQLKKRLVQMIVHDLKNPLNSILLNSQYVLDKTPQGSGIADAMQDVAETSQSMHRMLLNILDVMLLEGRELKVQLSPVDLSIPIESAVKTLQPVSQKTDHVIEVNGQTDIPKVPIDTKLIQRVLENLLENSLKYSPQDTHVQVEFGVDAEDEISIDISDQGPGIPEDKRNQVFELYTQLEPDIEVDKTIRHERGRGLGLAFCKMAVEAHGGRIWVDENQPQGAAFHIRLPRRTEVVRI